MFKSEKLCNQVRDEIVLKKVENIAQGLLLNGNKVFAIPILTASGL